MSRILALARHRTPAVPASAARGFLEASGVVFTSAVHLALATQPQLHIFFVLAAVTGWAGYAWYRYQQDPDVLAGWGFRTDNLRAAFVAPATLAVGAAAVMLAMSQWLGTSLHWTAVIPLLLYPIWGLVQQYLLQALVAGNLRDSGVKPIAVTLLTATLFGLVHFPYPALMVSTFLLGLAFTPMYLRWNNLWPLGLFHGWLGTLLYFLVLGRNPIFEMLGM